MTTLTLSQNSKKSAPISVKAKAKLLAQQIIDEIMKAGASTISDADLFEIVDPLVQQVRDRFIDKINTLTLTDVVQNPYLCCSMYGTIESLLRSQIEAKLSSSRETHYGNLLQEIITCIDAVANNVPLAEMNREGMDFEKIIVKKLATLELSIAMKSGAKWANSQSANGQAIDFKKGNASAYSVMGIATGKTISKPDYADLKVSGQIFWTMMSRDSQMYLRIMKFLAHGAGDFEVRHRAAVDQCYERLTQAALKYDSVQALCTNIAEKTGSNLDENGRINA